MKCQIIPNTFFLALVCVVFTSCPKEQPQALLIQNMMAMSQQTQCMLRPGGGGGAQFIRMNGVLDIGITNQYWLFPMFKNMLPTLKEATGLQPSNLAPTETNYINVYKAHVHVNVGGLFDLKELDGKDRATFEEVLSRGFTLDVAGSAGPNEVSAVSVQAIPPWLGNIIDKYVSRYAASKPGIWMTLYVKLEGRTQDRWVIYSNEFSFPVLVCYGCLVRYVTNDPTTPPSASSVPCLPGQDDPVDNNFCPYVANHPDVCGW